MQNIPEDRLGERLSAISRQLKLPSSSIISSSFIVRRGGGLSQMFFADRWSLLGVRGSGESGRQRTWSSFSSGYSSLIGSV